MHPNPRAHRARNGFVLPLVIVATILVALLAASAQFAAWRASRAARQAWNGERALLATDEAIATTFAAWTAEQFARVGIGATRTTRQRTAAGIDVDITVTRTQPLAALISADAQSQTDGAPTRAQRTTARALFLAPPPLPLHSALLIIDAARVLGTATISGIDSAPHDECGPWRDTASINGLRAYPATIDSTATISGLGAPSTPRTLAQDAIDFDRAWPLVRARAVSRPPPSAALPVEPPWRPLLFRDTSAVHVSGLWQHQGVLAVDHDLIVHDTLRLRGMLLVRGALDASSGRLEVDGAVLVRGQTTRATRIGSGSTIRYDQCALRRAIAAIATPETGPFRQWSER